MKSVKLVCLISGNKKSGKGPWFKATLLSHNSEGKPVTGEFFLPEDVGERCVREGLIEDVLVNVEFEFDEFMHPMISNIIKASVPPHSDTKIGVKS